MINTLRDQLKVNSYKFLLWFMVLALGFGSLPSILKQIGAGGTWVFRVNSQEINRSLLAGEIEKQNIYLHHLRAQLGQYADMLMKNNNIQQRAVFEVQKEELLHQVAKNTGIFISPLYSAEKLHDRRFLFSELAGLVPYEALTSKGLDENMLFKYLLKRGMDMNDFEYKVERILATDLIENLVGIGAYVPQFELASLSMAQNQDKKFSYLELSLDNYITKEAKKEKSDADLMAFYIRQNQESHRYQVPEKRSGVVWSFNVDGYVDSSNKYCDDSCVQNYYDTHIASPELQDQPTRVQVRTLVLELPKNETDRYKALKEAQNIRAELIKNPSFFVDQVSKLSIDAETKKNSGLVPFFAKGEKEALFERTAFLLKAPGDISEVIETDRGFEILQLVEKKMRTVKPLSVAKDSIKKKLMKQVFDGRFESDVRDLMAQDNNMAVVSAYAQKKHATRQNFNAVSEKSIKEYSPEKSRQLKKLFEIKGLNKVVSFIDKDAGLVIYLTEIENKYTPEFEQVKDKVKADFNLFLAEKALKTDLQEARSLAHSLSMQELQQKFGGQTSISNWLSPQDTDKLTAFFPQGTPLSSLLELEMPGSLFSTVIKDKGVLVKVDAVKPLDQNVNDSKQKALKAELNSRQNNLVFEGFVASLFKNAIIETHESMFIAE